MDSKYDWLNSQIDRLQAGMALSVSLPGVEHRPGAEDIGLLRMAARLSAARPGRAELDPAFKAQLGARVRAAAEAAPPPPAEL